MPKGLEVHDEPKKLSMMIWHKNIMFLLPVRPCEAAKAKIKSSKPPMIIMFRRRSCNLKAINVHSKSQHFWPPNWLHYNDVMIWIDNREIFTIDEVATSGPPTLFDNDSWELEKHSNTSQIIWDLQCFPFHLVEDCMLNKTIWKTPW